MLYSGRITIFLPGLTTETNATSRSPMERSLGLSSSSPEPAFPDLEKEKDFVTRLGRSENFLHRSSHPKV